MNYNPLYLKKCILTKSYNIDIYIFYEKNSNISNFIKCIKFEEMNVAECCLINLSNCRVTNYNMLKLY